jgi:hypothetical protein
MECVAGSLEHFRSVVVPATLLVAVCWYTPVQLAEGGLEQKTQPAT